MIDESLYLTTHEAALAVVATAMKKARLLLDTLAINSLMGGILFASGGMLHVLVQSHCPALYEANPGIVELIQGMLYPIGLFYVVLMGVDLFNSNILFFSVGLARGAVSILDLLISWLVSWWLNLVGTIFVCYVICDYSHVTRSQLWIDGSIAILESKLLFSFLETLIKSMAGNFYVCLAIYLQLMAKPLHVKFLMMALPIFTFVSLGFTHSVADMYMIVIGLINGAPFSVATVAWKLFLPSALGNIIGGSFFGLVIPWYLHIVVVERDQRMLHLPLYEMRDEQPELNQDSRVVRVETHAGVPLTEEDAPLLEKHQVSSGLSMMSQNEDNLARAYTTRSSHRREQQMSPANVFPVYGMGPPSERERSIASGAKIDDDEIDGERRPTATFVGEQIKRTLSRRLTPKKDLEASLGRSQSVRTHRDSVSSISIPRQLKRFSFSRTFSDGPTQLKDYNTRLLNAGVTQKAMMASNEAAGAAEYMPRRPESARMVRTTSERAPDSIIEKPLDSCDPSTTPSVQNYCPGS